MVEIIQISKEQGDYILDGIDEDTDFIIQVVGDTIYLTDITEEPVIFEEMDCAVHAIFRPNERGYKVLMKFTFISYLKEKNKMFKV